MHQIFVELRIKVAKNYTECLSSDESKEVKSCVLCCDKCDGKHETDDCPHYKKKREVHIDAQKNGWKLVGGSSTLPGEFELFIRK